VEHQRRPQATEKFPYGQIKKKKINGWGEEMRKNVYVVRICALKITAVRKGFDAKNVKRGHTHIQFV
jgi:hypothetical protein